MEQENYWTRLRKGRISRRTFLAGSVTAGAALAAAATVGCSDDDDTSPAGSGSPAAGTSPAAGQPRRGGILTFNTNTEADHMDPHLSANIATAASTIGLAYSRLFKKKLGPGGLPNAMIAEGDLVERVENPEPNVYIFHLRRGVKFHNLPPVNGRELVANDVIQSFERQRASKVNANVLADVVSWTATDNYTLRFQLQAPNADFLLNLTEPRAPIVPHETWEQSPSGDLKQGPIVGSGAWIFREWQPNQLARFERNPAYYIPGLPYADGVTILRLTDPQLARSALSEGKLLALGQLNRQSADLIKGSGSFVEQTGGVAASLGGIKLWMHSQKAPFTDQRVRQAASKAINRQSFVDAIAFGNAFINAACGVPDKSWYLPDSDVQTLLKQDVTGAKALMAQAGVTSASPRMFAGVRNFPFIIPGAELLADQLRAIGINIQIDPVDGPTINQTFAQGLHDGGYGTLNPGPSPTIVLERFFKSTGASNGYKLNDPQLDSLIERQKTLIDKPAERKQAFLDIQRRIIETAVVAPVYISDDLTLVSSKLKNYVVATLENAQYEVAWLEA